MKCLNCKSAEGVLDWWLAPVDFEEFGNTNNLFNLEKCFCPTCYNNNEIKLDQILYNYWLSIQPIDELMKEGIMIKYPTKEEYPDGFKWFAIDQNGEAFWYKSRPFYKLDDTWWDAGNSQDWERAYDYDVDEYSAWKNTLLCKDDLREETKPNYYTWHSKVSCKEVSQEFMSNLGQAIQYIWRSNVLQTTKGQSTEEVIADLNKAIDFVRFEIERLENE